MFSPWIYNHGFASPLDQSVLSFPCAAQSVPFTLFPHSGVRNPFSCAGVFFASARSHFPLRLTPPKPFSLGGDHKIQVVTFPSSPSVALWGCPTPQWWHSVRRSPPFIPFFARSNPWMFFPKQGREILFSWRRTFGFEPPSSRRNNPVCFFPSLPGRMPLPPPRQTRFPLLTKLYQTFFCFFILCAIFFLPRQPRMVPPLR